MLPRSLGHRFPHGFLCHFGRIWAALLRLHVRKLVTECRDAAGLERRGGALHERMVHARPRAVREHVDGLRVSLRQ